MSRRALASEPAVPSRREFLGLAARMKLHVETTAYDLAHADQALRDLAADQVNGAAVLLARS